jgi:hypothetical protein
MHPRFDLFQDRSDDPAASAAASVESASAKEQKYNEKYDKRCSTHDLYLHRVDVS